MGSRVVHVIFHCQNDASRSQIFVHTRPGSEFLSLGSDAQRSPQMDWAFESDSFISFHFRRPKIHWSKEQIAENLGDSWSPWWWFLDQRRPGVKRIGWAVLPGHVPPGLRQVQLPLAATYEARPKILLKLPLFRLFSACICLRFFVFLRKIQMRHELESKMRKNQRKLEMQYSFTSLRGGQLRSISIPWTVTSHWKDERKNYRLDESSSSCTQDCCSKRLMRTEHTNI